MRVLSTVKFTALRMARNFIVLLLLLIMPMALLTMFSFILSGMVNAEGVPFIYENATIMVLVFQLFSGSIVMYLINNDLFAENRMRMAVLPFSRTMYAFSIMACGAVYSIVLGVLLMTFAQFALGVPWGNWSWMLFMICLLAVLSIIISLIFTFSVRKYKTAERLNELYGVGFVVLAGLFFPLPSNPVFDFLGSHGNPLMLALLSIDALQRSEPAEAWTYAGVLLAAIAVLFIVMLAAGRRRMS